jgi:hypothetical protein
MIHDIDAVMSWSEPGCGKVEVEILTVKFTR